MRVSPEQPKSASVGRVWVEGAAVCARYPEKDEAWRVACKRLLYGWSFNCWKRTFADDEIAAELGMDADEVLRFKHHSGLPELFRNGAYSMAWE